MNTNNTVNQGCHGWTKTKDLKPDSDGWYYVQLCRANTKRISGEHLESISLDVIEKLNVRAKAGVLRGEFQASVNSSDRREMMCVDEKKVSHTFKDIEVKTETLPNGDEIQLLFGKVKGIGPRKNLFEMAIAENKGLLKLGFRAISEIKTNLENRTISFILKDIVTFDLI